MKKTLFVIACLSFTLFRVTTLAVIASGIAEQETANVVGKEIELSLKDPFGTEQRLSALKGRIVVLNFWATDCIPCRKQMPQLAAIQNEYAAFGVQVIGASTDSVGHRDQVLQFVKETTVNFPVWMGATTADMIRFGLGSAPPGTVVINSDGRIAKVIAGIVNQAELKKQIDAMLAAAEKVDTKQRQEIARHKQSEVSSVPS